MTFLNSTFNNFSDSEYQKPQGKVVGNLCTGNENVLQRCTSEAEFVSHPGNYRQFWDLRWNLYLSLIRRLGCCCATLRKGGTLATLMRN